MKILTFDTRWHLFDTKPAFGNAGLLFWMVYKWVFFFLSIKINPSIWTCAIYFPEGWHGTYLNIPEWIAKMLQPMENSSYYYQLNFSGCSLLSVPFNILLHLLSFLQSLGLRTNETTPEDQRKKVSLRLFQGQFEKKKAFL